MRSASLIASSEPRPRYGSKSRSESPREAKEWGAARAAMLPPGVPPVPPVRRHRAARQHATPSLFVLQSIEHVFDEAPIPADRRRQQAGDEHLDPPEEQRGSHQQRLHG